MEGHRGGIGGRGMEGIGDREKGWWIMEADWGRGREGVANSITLLLLCCKSFLSYCIGIKCLSRVVQEIYLTDNNDFNKNNRSS